MQKNKDSFLEKIHTHLFADREKLPQVFDKAQQEVVIRFRTVFVKWLSEPYLRDIDIINYLKNECEISEAQAYRDLPRIKALIGNVSNAGKEFQRYRASEMVLKGYHIARDAGSNMEVKQAMAMIRAGEALVKVHKLDKEEVDTIPWEDIIPMDLEPTTDVSVIGRSKIDNLQELQTRLRKKYGSQPIEDTSFIDLNNNEKEESLL